MKEQKRLDLKEKSDLQKQVQDLNLKWAAAEGTIVALKDQIISMLEQKAQDDAKFNSEAKKLQETVSKMRKEKEQQAPKIWPDNQDAVDAIAKYGKDNNIPGMNNLEGVVVFQVI